MSSDTQSIVAYTSLCVIGSILTALCCMCNPCKKEQRRVRFHPIVERTEFTPLSVVSTTPIATALVISDIEKIDTELVI